MVRAVTGLCCLAVAVIASADARHVIICGSGGEQEYIDRFAEWGARLERALVDRAGNPADCIHLLMGDATATTTLLSDLQTIERVFSEIAAVASTDDDIIVYLIGHGSFRRDVAKLNIPGPDLAANDLKAMLDAIPARHRVVINTASSSAPFINAFAGSGAIVCTATNSAEERNATEFMEHFIQAIEQGSADQDRDERISVFEACNQAAALTAAWYKNESLVASEHPLLDVSSNGLGERLPFEAEDSKAAGAANAVYIKDYVFPPSVPAELIQQYRETLRAIDELKQTKTAMPETDYYARLEPLLLKAAQLNRTIRSHTAPIP